MPADMQRLIRDKDLIVTTISTKGPSLPIHVARAASLSLLFASAFLSELYREKRVKMSSMKVGSSPLYFIEGQEPQLENFIEHLNHKEREAFLLLKKERVLDDELQVPAIRVALREIKDFAIPVQVRIKDVPKLFWKYYLLKEDELRSSLQNVLYPELEAEKSKKEEKIEEPKLKEEIKDTTPEVKETREIENKEETKKPEKKKKVKEAKPQVFAFTEKIKSFLAGKDMELLELKEEKKKEMHARISLNAPFGKQEFYLIAKDKKKISEEDIIHALHKAQLEKMPALILAPGEIDKKSQETAKLWKNLVKFEKLK